jgi:hypothetical protein
MRLRHFGRELSARFRVEGRDCPPGPVADATTPYRFRSVSWPAGPRRFFCRSNYLGSYELTDMPKDRSQIGPMNTQPVERASTMATPAQPMMPAIGTVKKDSSPKREPTRTETLRALIAK